MFLHCPLEPPRIAFADLVTHAISQLSPVEQSSYDEDSQLKLSKEEEDPNRPKSSILALIDCMLSTHMLKSVRRHPRHCAQYFLIVKNFAAVSPAERKYLVVRKVIARFIEFTLGLGEYPHRITVHRQITKQRYAKMGSETSATTTTSTSTTSTQTEMALHASRISPPNLIHMVELFALIVRSCATPDAPETAPKAPTQLEGPTLTLATVDQELLFGKVCVK
jgi:hypothetical protein